MAGVQQRLKLKQTPIDTWSVKEHLTLASAVLRTGDQVGQHTSSLKQNLGFKFVLMRMESLDLLVRIVGSDSS
jgi:hypothetical protein